MLKKAVSIILAFILVFSLAACSGDNTGETLPPPPLEPTPFSDESVSRTFMIYIVGSDLETDGGLATNDIIEIMESGVDLEWNNVLIQAGGALIWHNDLVPSDKTEIYQIVEGGIARVQELPSQNMASPDTLANFLSFCYENYESDAYSLILWNHGAGPMFGFGHDEIYNDILSLADMVKALNNSPFGPNNKLEFIGFDACLMGSIEVAFAFKDLASYLISSQEVIPGWGWEYSFLGQITPTMTTEGIAAAIIDSYFDIMELVFSIRPDFTTDISLSCLKLDNLSAIEGSLNDLYAKAADSLEPASFPASALVRDNVKEFGTINTDAYFDLVDMRHLCDLMANQYPAEAQLLSDALNSIVVYSKANVPNVGGVSLYFPYKEKEMMDELASLYATFNFAGSYTGYIQKFVDLLQDSPTIDWNLSKAASGQESETEFFVQLTPEQAGTFASASFQVLLVVTDGMDVFADTIAEHREAHADAIAQDPDYWEEFYVSYAESFAGYYSVFYSSDVTLDESGRLHANYKGKTQMLLDPETGDPRMVNMEEQEITNTYARYYIPVVLSDWSDLLDGGVRVENVNIQIQTDRDGSNVRFLSATPRSTNEDNPHIADRKIVDIYEYEWAEFFFAGRVPSYNDDGSLKPFAEWESNESAIINEIKLDSETKDSVTFVQGELENDLTYVLVFNIKDVYGNVVSSDMIPIDFKTRGS